MKINHTERRKKDNKKDSAFWSTWKDLNKKQDKKGK